MSTQAKPQMARPGVLSLNINSKSALYAAYMPFLNNGGLFVPTPKTYNLGDEVFMLLQLMDDPTRHPVAGRVVWVTPPGAQGGKTPGWACSSRTTRQARACVGGSSRSLRATLVPTVRRIHFKLRPVATTDRADGAFQKTSDVRRFPLPSRFPRSCRARG